MENSITPDLEDVQLLKAATSLLLKRAYEELESAELPQKNSIFGRAAPVVTLEGLGRMFMVFSQMEEGEEPENAMITLSNDDIALMRALAIRARQNHLERSQPKLPAPK